LIIIVFNTIIAKLPEINYQKLIILQIRCKVTTIFAHMQAFGHFFWKKSDLGNKKAPRNALFVCL